MIEGVVNAAYEAVVTLPLRGPEGQYREIAAVIDTGYNGFPTLPTPVVAELGLAFGGIGRATLAIWQRGGLRCLRRDGDLGRHRQIRFS